MPRILDSIIQRTSLRWESLNSNAPCGFVLVCLLSVSQFLVMDSNKASVSSSSLNKSKFILKDNFLSTTEL